MAICFAHHSDVWNQGWVAESQQWVQRWGPDGQRVGVPTSHPCMSAFELLCAVPFRAGLFPSWVQLHQFHLRNTND